MRHDDDPARLASRFGVDVDEFTARLGEPAEWLAAGNPIDAPCDSVPGWEGGPVTVAEIAPSIDQTPEEPGLPPSARLVGLGASGATVEVGPVAASGSMIEVEVFEGDGELAWGGGLAIPERVGGLSFDEPAVASGRTVIVRMRCAAPLMNVSLDLLTETSWLQTDAHVSVANNSDTGGVAGRLTYLLTDTYILGEPSNAGDTTPPGTTVFYRPGFESAASSLASAVRVNASNAPIEPWPADPTGLTRENPELADTDVLIVVGNDLHPDALT